MSDPTTDNKVADFLNGIVNAFATGGEAAAKVYLVALAPGLFAYPLVGWIADELLSYLGQILSIAGQKFATQIVIDIQTNGEKSSVITAATAFQIALASGNSGAIQDAANTLSGAYGDLVHFDGWSTPVG